MRWLPLALFLLAGCQAALPAPYDLLQAALVSQNTPALIALAARGGYPGLLAARALAEDQVLPAFLRAPYAYRWANFLERAQAFGPEDQPGPAWALAAPLLAEAGDRRRAAIAYAHLLPDPQAAQALLHLEHGDALYQTLFDGGAYALLLKVLPEGVRPDLRARSLYLLGHYRESIPFYQAWARENRRGWLGLAWAYWMSGHHRQALAALQHYPQPDGFYALGVMLEALGQTQAAIRAYEQSTAQGIWRAAGLLEREGHPHQALSQYLRIASDAQSPGPAAAYRAWVLARRLNLPAQEQEAWADLQGGYALLAGKPYTLPQVPSPILPELSQVQIAQALEAAGQTSWARGELRYSLLHTQDPAAQLALDEALYQAGAYREAVRWAEQLPPSRLDLELRYPRPYRSWVEEAAHQEGLDPRLIWAVMRVESRFDPLAESRTGALGLMQFVAPTWQDVARMLHQNPPASPTDPQAAILYGARYLAWLFQACQAWTGLEQLACVVTAYNGGIGYVLDGLKKAHNVNDFLRFQPRNEPRHYLELVLGSYAAYQALYPQRTAAQP
jgi:soluble lytic murein transglycosylase